MCLPPTWAALSRGAVNPANGIFYYAYASSTGTMVLFAFNTTTNTAIGQVATASAPLFSNGDIAFDGGGNLYWVGSSGTTAELGVIPGPIPTTAGNARADRQNGRHLSQSEQRPVRRHRVRQRRQSLPPGARRRHDLRRAGQPAHGRNHRRPDHGQPGHRGHRPGQLRDDSVAEPEEERRRPDPGGATSSIWRSPAPGITGTTTGATATTSGTTNGVQTQQAGPLPVVSGNVYTLAETPSGTTNFSSYTSTYSCVNTATSAVVQTGSGTSITLTMPTPGPAQTGPPVVCTFTNTPLTSSLSIVKSATATPNPVTTVGSDGDVSLHGHEHRPDSAHQRARDRYADAAGGWSDVGADVRVVGDSGGYVLGFVDVARGGSVGDVRRDVHGDAGRSGPRVDQRFGDRDRDAAVGAGHDLAAVDGDA